MKKNLPVPSAPRAPLGHRWLWWIGPPALITAAYRLIPPRIRGLWNPKKRPTSHIGMASILAGGGWLAFFYFILPFGTSEPNMWWLPQPGGRTDDGFVPFWLQKGPPKR
jgi:hypothetical protein